MFNTILWKWQPWFHMCNYVLLSTLGAWSAFVTNDLTIFHHRVHPTCPLVAQTTLSVALSVMWSWAYPAPSSSSHYLLCLKEFSFCLKTKNICWYFASDIKSHKSWHSSHLFSNWHELGIFHKDSYLIYWEQGYNPYDLWASCSTKLA